MTKPCAVKMENTPVENTSISPGEINTAIQKVENTKFQNVNCIYCSKKVFKSHILGHMRTVHPKTFIKCPQHGCSTFFENEKNKEEHLLRVHATYDRKVKKCVYCGAYLKDHKTQWSHMKLIHKDVAIRCSYNLCSTYFLTQEEKQIHLEEVHKITEKVKCVYCDFAFTTAILRQHVYNVHADVAIKCNFSFNCPTYFKSVQLLERHVQEVHKTPKLEEKHTCFYCAKVFASRQNHKDHVRKVHQDVAIKCNVFKCLQFFRTEQECDEHFREKHEEQEKMKKIKCPHCDYRTNNEDCIKQHVALKHGTENLKCPECPGKVYKSQLALRRHLQLIHYRGSVTCAHCDETYQRSEISKHLRSEICPLCSAKLACFGLAKKHRLECKISDSKCDICGKVFRLPCRFKAHYNVCRKKTWQRLKYESRGFGCQKCKRYYATEKDLVDHCKDFHPVECDFCRKTYKTRKSVKSHIMKQHLEISQEKKFQCGLCDAAFSSRDQLRRHCRHLHSRRNFVECDKCDSILIETTMRAHNAAFH